jgi:hypothetical protein
MLKLYNFYMYYAKNVQEIYIEKPICILLPRKTSGAMFFAHLSHCFNSFFM